MAHVSDTNTVAASTSENSGDDSLEAVLPVPRTGRMVRVLELLKDDVDVDGATTPLLMQSFLTGMIDGAVFNLLPVWQGFMTGNIILVASNIAEYIYPGTQRHPLELVGRSVALVAFFLGAFLGERIGDWWGPKCRGWHITACLVQGGLLGGAAGLVFAQPKPLVASYDWGPGVLAMTSTAMGMQAISSFRLGSPAFGTTTAFTGAVTQVAADPMLFRCPSSKTRTRDLRIVAVAAVAFGGGVGQTLVIKLGLGWAFIFVVGIKVVVALSWWFNKAEPHLVGPIDSMRHL